MTHRKHMALALLLVGVAVTAAATVWSPPDSAANSNGLFDVYVRIDGVPGPVTTPGYEGWFEADALGTRIARQVGAGRAEFSPQRFLGDLDAALPALLDRFATGQRFDEVEFRFVIPVRPPIPVLTIGLENVYVGGIDQGGDGAGPRDNVATLDYDRIRWTTSYFDPRNGGWQIDASTATWDRRTNQR